MMYESMMLRGAKSYTPGVSGGALELFRKHNV
jgi:hypothetical protein